jgi:hypothetical protein
MEIEYDEKGKIFTDIVSKEVVLTDIQTVTHHIRGNIHVRKGDRLSDEINQPYQFLPVTSVIIYSPSGEILDHCDFLAINREHIVWLKPVAERHGEGD